jgi:hypothetical protein
MAMVTAPSTSESRTCAAPATPDTRDAPARAGRTPNADWCPLAGAGRSRLGRRAPSSTSDHANRRLFGIQTGINP